MTPIQKSFDDLLAAGACEIARPEDSLIFAHAVYRGQHVFVEFTAADDGSKAIFELEHDQDVEAALAAVSPVRWCAGAASVLAPKTSLAAPPS